MCVCILYVYLYVHIYIYGCTCICMCLCEYVYVHACPHMSASSEGDRKKAWYSLELELWDARCDCWKSNSGPLGGQQVLLPVESSLQRLLCSFNLTPDTFLKCSEVFHVYLVYLLQAKKSSLPRDFGELVLRLQSHDCYNQCFWPLHISRPVHWTGMKNVWRWSVARCGMVPQYSRDWGRRINASSRPLWNT